MSQAPGSPTPPRYQKWFDHLPPCPVVFTRLMEALSRSDKRRVDLPEIISMDPALTAQVLRVANSAFYGVRARIRSLQEAVLRLGYDEIWAIATAFKGKELFQDADGNWSPLHQKFWNHALTAAYVARVLGARLNPGCMEIYFTVGILHDIGKGLLALCEPTYGAVCKNGQLRGAELVQEEVAGFGIGHDELGAAMLRNWDLPEMISKLVAGHHQDPDPADSVFKVALLVAASDTLAHAMVEAPPGKGLKVKLDPRIVKELKLDGPGIERVVAEARKELEKVG